MYKIGKRLRTNFLDGRDMAVDGYRVYFTMEDGTVDYIEIEKSQFNVDNVKTAIEASIQEHEELAAL